MSEHVSVKLESVTSELLGIDIMSSAGYFKAVEQGISGAKLRTLVKLTNDREVFARVIGRDKSNLSKAYSLKLLPKMMGDNVLDTTRIYALAARVYGSLELGTEWLHTPIPALEGRVPAQMLDSHAGREIVRETLRKIEYGEYS